ncbi:MAG: tetratricopeptide repeat protein [Candidatus Aureabacteria bacterium]|nr:tetratricopeptide repeat protein [Candidatus Auribacterota bacterium]
MRLLGKDGSAISLSAALLFSVHPLLSEPVNYIQARHVLFYSLFTLSSTIISLLFISSRKSFSKLIFSLCMLISFVLAALSKEVGIFYVPSAILLTFAAFWDNIENNSFIKKRFYLLIFLIAAALILITHSIRPLTNLFSAGYSLGLGKRTFVVNLLTHSVIFFKYLKLLVPLSSHLNVDHNMTLIRLNSFSDCFLAFSSFFTLLFLSFIAWKRKKRDPLFFFLFFWGIMGIFPYMIVTKGSAELMIEYKFYLSAIGFIGLIMVFLNRFYQYLSMKYRHRGTGIIYGIILSLAVFFCISETRKRNTVWKNEMTLWGDALSKSPQSIKPHHNLGVYLSETGKTDDAKYYFYEALKIQPQSAHLHSNLGTLFLNEGNIQKAFHHFEKALSLGSQSVQTYNNMGICFDKMGKHDQALYQYYKALEIDRNNADAHNNLAVYYSKKKNWEKSFYHFDKALLAEPNNAKTYFNMGIAYFEKGDIDKAIFHFSQTASFEPEHLYAHYFLGMLSHSQKRLKDAVPHYETAIDLAKKAKNTTLLKKIQDHYQACIDQLNSSQKKDNDD